MFKLTSSTTLVDFYRQLPHAQFPVLFSPCDRNVWQHLLVRAAVLQDEVLREQAALTGDHLNDILLLNSSSLEPHIADVSKNRQYHSH